MPLSTHFDTHLRHIYLKMVLISAMCKNFLDTKTLELLKYTPK